MNEIWFNNIYRKINELSDIELQKMAWLGKLPNYISSFDELYDSFFDDYSFDLFLEEELPKMSRVSSHFISDMTKLRDMLNEYDNGDLTDQEIISDKKWLRVVDQAQKVKREWEKNIDTPLLDS